MRWTVIADRQWAQLSLATKVAEIGCVIQRAKNSLNLASEACYTEIDREVCRANFFLTSCRLAVPLGQSQLVFLV